MMTRRFLVVFLFGLLVVSIISVGVPQMAVAAEYSWASIGSFPTAIYSIIWVGNDLYAGCGNSHVYRWDGTSWTDTGDAGGGAYVYTIAWNGANLFTGGWNGHVYRYDGGTIWTDMGSPSGSPGDRAINSLFYNGTSMYAGVQNGHVYRYNGPSDWIDLGATGAEHVYSLGWNGTSLFAGAGSMANHIFRYAGGTTWVDTGGTWGDYVTSLAWNGTNMYAGCANDAADGGSVFRYDGGTTWTDVGSPAGSAVQCLNWDGADLYVGCYNGHVYRYGGGTTWTDMGNTGGSAVRSLAWRGSTLYAGCNLGVFRGQVPPSFEWYLAEGTTAWGFETYITIQNPNSSALSATVTYMPTGRSNVTETVNLPASSQTTLTNDHLVQKMGGEYDFSTTVTGSDATKSIAVDRTMFWSSSRSAEPEAHSSIGVTSPAQTWYLPEGSTNWGFETWLLIQNPNPSKAVCAVTYMIEGEGPQSFTKEVPAHSRRSFNMADDIGSKDASIKVVSDTPVIPERAMYRNDRSEGHDSIGTTTPASDYYLAEGTTAWGFTTYVLVQNPNATSCDVTITYMTPDGARPQASFPMPANSRKTIRVNEVLPNTDFSTRVHGSEPIIAERAMYWYYDDGGYLTEKCHDSIGMDRPHSVFYLPDGDASPNYGAETWTLVQNPNSVPVTVEITYMTPSGAGNVTFTDTIPASSRKTYNMADRIPGSRAATMVRSKTTGKKIMVERAMYWANRSAGTDTIGGYSD
jgi:hypothetical protein